MYEYKKTLYVAVQSGHLRVKQQIKSTSVCVCVCVACLIK